MYQLSWHTLVQPKGIDVYGVLAQRAPDPVPTPFDAMSRFFHITRTARSAVFVGAVIGPNLAPAAAMATEAAPTPVHGDSVGVQGPQQDRFMSFFKDTYVWPGLSCVAVLPGCCAMCCGLGCDDLRSLVLACDAWFGT